MTQRKSDTKHGLGAAHTRYGMFVARGPLLAPEDAGGGSSAGGTGGGDSGSGSATGGDQQGQQQQAAGGVQGKTYTQADLDRVVGERLARDRKERGNGSTQQQQSQQRQETRQSEGTGQGTQQQSATTSVDAVFQLEMNDAIEAVEEKLGVKVPASARKRIRTVGQVERPGDKEAYVTGWVTDLGLGKKTDNTQNINQGGKGGTGNGQQQTQQQNQNGGQSGSGFNSDLGGANGGETRDFEQISLERPLELTAGDIERMRLKHGEDKANEMIRDRVNGFLKNVKLIADPRRLEQMRRQKQ